ncbi:MAG: polysaccharide biosynthesis protein, partial [Pirellulaceae bacterium]|nr:polysaccharide biosynthesis protein [Pirellulaceae bacterium]
MSTSGSPITTQRTLLVGTGRAIAELRHLLMLLEPPAHILGCVLPHDEDLQSSLLSSVPVLGRFEELAVIVERQDVDLVLVSFPVALIREMLPLKRQLTQRSTPWQFLPMLTDQLNGRHLDFPGAWMHQVGVATDSSAAFFRHAGNHSGCEPWQLLQRRPRPLDEESISQVLTGRRVLISGAGGSIGSQLALGVAGFKPAKLVLVERSENALFEIDRQIARLHPNL